MTLVKQSLNSTEHFEKNPFVKKKEPKKHLNIQLPIPSSNNPLNKVKKIKKSKKKSKPSISGEISSSNQSPMAKPEIRMEEMKMFSQWTAIMTKVKP